MTPTPGQPSVALNDGRRIPALGLGVWQVPDADVAGVLSVALDAGYRHVDTATIYRNEAGVGDALAHGPPDVFVTTKVWNSEQGYESTLRAFEASAARLRRDVIDLYLIHWAAPRRDLYVDTWRALVRLREEGRARSIGVSNFTLAQLKRIIAETGVVPTVNQIELHPRFAQTELRAANASLGIATESWSPLGQGRVLNDPVVQRVAAKHSRTPAQVVIRWHLDQGLVVIPKSATPSRIAENFQVFDFHLDAEDLAGLAELDQGEAGRLGEHPDDH